MHGRIVGPFPRGAGNRVAATGEAHENGEQRALGEIAQLRSPESPPTERLLESLVEHECDIHGRLARNRMAATELIEESVLKKVQAMNLGARMLVQTDGTALSSFQLSKQGSLTRRCRAALAP